MRKSDMKKAIAEKWRVEDDFGIKGTVVGLGDAPDRLAVQFDGPSHKPIEQAHYRRVNPIFEDK